MKHTDVLILSAGCVARDLASVFGQLPSGMVPVNSKPAIGWIIDALLAQEFGRFLVTTGFKRELLEQHLSRAYGSRGCVTYVPVDHALPPGNAILEALPFVVSDDVLIILGDTIVQQDLALEESFVLTSTQFTDPTKWCLARTDARGHLVELVDKQDRPDTDGLAALIGVYYLRNVRALRDAAAALPRGSRHEISALLERYRAVDAIRCIAGHGWVDIGHLDRYHEAKVRLARPRAFNVLEHDGVRGVITKRSRNAEKLRDELQWYRELPSDLQVLAPRVVASEAGDHPSITMEYYGYPTLAELFVHGAIHPTIWNEILRKVTDVVQLFRAHPGPVTREDYRAMYVGKTRERIVRAAAQHDGIRAYTALPALVVNGRPCRNVSELLPFVERRADELYERSAATNCFLHGDLCFSNILYDTASGVVRVIDPRGRWGSSMFGDLRYDLAKLRHSVVGKYDFILNDLFALRADAASVTLEVYASQQHEEIAAQFDALLGQQWNVEDIAFIEGLLFLSMIPLHTERRERQLAMFATGLLRLNEVFDHDRIPARV